MRFSLSLTLLATLSVGLTRAKTLNVTAITGRDGQSAFECWALQPPLVESDQPGTAGMLTMSLGALGNASHSIFPPHFENPPHSVPTMQWVLFLSGMARITIPHTNETLYVLRGRNGLIFAADVAAVSESGHASACVSEEATRALQITTADGLAPPHDVVHDGPCAIVDA